VRHFQVQMIIQNPAIAALQTNKLRVQLGLENLPLIERNYFIRTAAKFDLLEEKPAKFSR
jgi:hypothetical protein